ncbi:protein terminal ear1 homolog [Humulus lupulus]|uniref:protein terminal ear1 homolog n=1 Tax=Humulus lupulus TaxID=3486 RepID=UPI002B40A559|nr:protein terminal ear1 homolog [Humulus lupulus]
MAEHRFPGNLDPKAEEFRPRNPSTNPANQVLLFGPPPPPVPVPVPTPLPQVYYPYTSPYHHHHPHMSEVQVLPFGDGSLGYPQFSSCAPATYVSSGSAVGPAAVAVRVPAPATSAISTRAVLLSSVPSEMNESMVRRELEAFGEVRGVQMERLYDGIVTVHFYDLRHAENALREIRDQHMQQQTRLRDYHFMISNSTTSSTIATTNASLVVPNSGLEEYNWATSVLLPPPIPPPARGLLAGRAVWAQFVIPATNSVPDGYNQGTIVIFNLDSEVTASTLQDIFQSFGPIKELRETPSKKHQKFVEFFDVRDAAKALVEMNGREINGKQIVIEFSRPGGHSRKFINAVTTTTHHKYSPPVARKLSNIPPRAYAAAAQTHQAQFPVRKSSFGKGNSNKGGSSSSTVQSVERKMASVNLGYNNSLCINGGAATDRDRDSHGAVLKRLSRKTHHSNTQSSSNQLLPPSAPPLPPPVLQSQQQSPTPVLRGRSRKGMKQGKKLDSRFLISEEAMTESNCRDTRTTVMIKNIPNKYSQKLLLNMLDNHCIHCNEQIANEDRGGMDDQPFSSYDFVYLPIDFNNKCNVGYGFVNMTSPEATWRLYKAFHLQHWEVFNSRKICEVTYARVQGLEALKEHFKNSKFPCEMDHYLPVVFSPPRDGKLLTEPLPIAGQTTKPSQPFPIGRDDDDHDHQQHEILDGHDHEVSENDIMNEDVFDGSNEDEEDDDDDFVAASGDQLSLNSTGFSSGQNGGVASDDE